MKGYRIGSHLVIGVGIFLRKSQTFLGKPLDFSQYWGYNNYNDKTRR